MRNHLTDMFALPRRAGFALYTTPPTNFNQFKGFNPTNDASVAFCWRCKAVISSWQQQRLPGESATSSRRSLSLGICRTQDCKTIHSLSPRVLILLSLAPARHLHPAHPEMRPWFRREPATVDIPKVSNNACTHPLPYDCKIQERNLCAASWTIYTAKGNVNQLRIEDCNAAAPQASNFTHRSPRCEDPICQAHGKEGLV